MNFTVTKKDLEVAISNPICNQQDNQRAYAGHCPIAQAARRAGLETASLQASGVDRYVLTYKGKAYPLTGTANLFTKNFDQKNFLGCHYLLPLEIFIDLEG